MSAGMLNESTILISAKLDEQKTVNTINSQLQKLKINPIEVTLADINGSKLEQQIQQTVKANSAKINNTNNVINAQKQNQQMALLATNIQKAQVQVQGLGKNWSAIKTNPELNAELQRLIASSKQLSTGSDLKQFNAELNTFKARCRAAGVATKSMGDSFKAAWKNFSFFFSASRLIYIVTNRTKELVTNVKNLNSAMIELRKVTDETENSYDRFLKKAKQNSKDVGMGLSEYVQATADFARLGYSVPESNELAKIAAMYKNVADDMDNIGTGTGTLISTMKAFNVESDNAVTIVDKLNEVSNNYAVTSGNLGEGLANSASSMSVAGNTLDETIALLTAGTEITQDASNMGNTLKVVSMRLRGMRGELEVLGEDVDENVESISKMQTQILNLTHGKVNIFDDNGDFKSTYEILQGIASVYKDLSSTEQADLLETIAGKHRGNAVAAILTNFSTAQNSLETSLNSAGSAAKENEKYMQGLEGHLQQLQSTWESLSSTLVNDDFLIGTVSAGTGIISTIDGIASSIGGLNTVVAGVGLGIFIKNLKNIKSHVELTSKAFDASKNIVNQYGVTTELSGTAIMQYRTALEGLSTSEQKAILTKIGLNQQQIETILGLNQQTTATTALTLSEMQQIAADIGLTSEQMNKIRQFTLGNLVIEGQTTATNELTQANITLLASYIGLKEKAQEYINKALAAKNANENIEKSTKGLGISLGSFFKSPLGVISIITTVFTVITSIINAVKQQQEEAYNKVVEKSEEATSHIQNVEQAWSRYLELGTSATEEEKRNALESVNEQLDNKIQNLQDATAAEKDYADAVRGSAKEDFLKAAADANAAAVAAKEQIAGQWNSDYTRKVDSEQANNQAVYDLVKNILDSYIKEDVDSNPSGVGSNYWYNIGSNIDTSNLEEVLNYYNLISQAVDIVERKAMELGKNGETLLNSDMYKNLLAILTKNEDKINDYVVNKAESIYQSTISQYGMPTNLKEFNKIYSAIQQTTSNSTLVADATINRLNKAFPIFAQKAQELVSTTAKSVSASIKSLDNLTKTIDDIQKAYETATTAIKEYNETGFLSIDNLQSLLELDDKYLKALIDENGQLTSNTDVYKKLILAELEELELQQIKAVLDNVEGLSKESAEAYALADAIDIENISHQNLIQTLIQEAMVRAQIKDVEENTTVYTQAIEASLPIIAKRIALIRQSSKAIKNETTSSTEALENENKVLKEQKELWEDKLDNLENTKSSIQDLIDLVTDMITKEKELEKDVLEKQKEDFDELIEKRKESLEIQKEELDIARELADKQNTVAKNALAASIAKLDDSGAGRKAQKEASDALNESRTDLEEYMSEREYDIRIESLEKLQTSNEEFYEKQIETIDEYLSDERQLYNDACSVIDNDNGELYGKLLKYVRKYTTTTDSEFQHLWQSASNALEKYGYKNITVASLMNNLNEQIYTVQDTVDNLDERINETSDTINTISNALGTTLADSIDNARISLDEYKEILEELQKIEPDVKKVNSEEISRRQYYKDNPEAANMWNTLADGIKKDFGLPVPKYAQGTRSAIGGLSITQENGYEFIPTSIGNGQYTLLDRGNPVFNATATRNLYDIANNPRDFLFDTLGNYSQHPANVISNTSVVSPTIKINIQGDATQSTVNALRHEAKNIIKQATENVMNIALRNKRLI